jgi:hypothetical protein
LSSSAAVASSRAAELARIVDYAVLSLTVVLSPDRRPHAAGGARDARTHVRPATLGFLGWFVPRGLASIVFAVVVVETEGTLPPEPAPDDLGCDLALNLVQPF